jgi:hypothetical protein
MNLVTCLEGCADDACDTQCFTTHAAGQAALDAVDACEATQCATECSAGGGTGGTGGSGGETVCDACVESKCGAPLNACLGDPDCVAFWDCVDPCQDDACEQACVTQHPNGAAKSDAVDGCVQQQCVTECGGP